MNRQQALVDASADSRRVDAWVEIKNPTVSASFSLAMHRFSEIARRGSMATEDEFSVLYGHLHALLAYSGHFDLESKPIGVLMKIHNGRNVFNTLSRFTPGWC
jgi:hypothetical protein